jgi:hypothetical protein
MVEAQKVFMSQLHNIEVQFIVLMFTPLTNSSCFSAISDAYQSYVLTLALVIPELAAFSCAVLKVSCFVLS